MEGGSELRFDDHALHLTDVMGIDDNTQKHPHIVGILLRYSEVYLWFPDSDPDVQQFISDWKRRK